MSSGLKGLRAIVQALDRRQRRLTRGAGAQVRHHRCHNDCVRVRRILRESQFSRLGSLVDETQRARVPLHERLERQRRAPLCKGERFPRTPVTRSVVPQSRRPRSSRRFPAPSLSLATASSRPSRSKRRMRGDQRRVCGFFLKIGWRSDKMTCSPEGWRTLMPASLSHFCHLSSCIAPLPESTDAPKVGQLQGRRGVRRLLERARQIPCYSCKPLAGGRSL